MILQRATLITLTTQDGLFSLEGKVPLGTEVWIQPRTLAYREFQARNSGKAHRQLVMLEESGAPLPVELLEFSCQFRVEE